MEWPACSQNMNPIENVWDALGRRVGGRQPPPQTLQRTGKSSSFTCRNCGGGDRGRVAIYRPFGEFRRAKSYCHLYGAQGQRQAYLLPMPR
ncbi:hypothetical protein TNCV_2421241 [Trichonephila clavipes]|nr:hypothetical protein TNCV_2421241 [Trichonephila clavipes]